MDESTAQSMLYTGGYTIEATVNPKIQTAMENLMLNTDDAYFPAGWHEEEVTSISDDDVQVYNEDGTPKTRTGDDGTVYYYATSAPRRRWSRWTMTQCHRHGGRSGRKDQEPFPEPRLRRHPSDRLYHQAHRRYALGIEYGLVNWSTMLNNSPLYLKQDMVIRDETTAAGTASWV